MSAEIAMDADKIGARCGDAARARRRTAKQSAFNVPTPNYHYKYIRK